MLSKFVRPSLSKVLLRRACNPGSTVRGMWGVPTTHYDTPMSKKLNVLHVMKVHWELAPLIIVTALAGVMVLGSIMWAVFNKVDVVLTSHSRNNLSRTMDLRQPTVHKLLTISQEYRPWPEMQDVLDKMADEESRINSLMPCAPKSR